MRPEKPGANESIRMGYGEFSANQPRLEPRLEQIMKTVIPLTH